MINDDVIFEPDFLELGVKILDTKSKMLLCVQRFGQQTEKCLDTGVRFTRDTLTFIQEISPDNTSDSFLNDSKRLSGLTVPALSYFFKVGSIPILRTILSGDDAVTTKG